MQAVIRIGGKQYLVRVGQVIEVDLVSPDAKTVDIETLLLIDGDTVNVGTPVLDTRVTAEVLGEVKGEKLQVLKFQAKKRVNKRTGHRQRYTQIKITAIGEAQAAAKAQTTRPKKKAPAAATT